VVYFPRGNGSFSERRAQLFSFVNTGNIFKTAATYGIARGKNKIVVQSAKAKVRLNTTVPTFFFYLETSTLAPMSSPSEFVLAKMDANLKERERESDVRPDGRQG